MKLKILNEDNPYSDLPEEEDQFYDEVVEALSAETDQDIQLCKWASQNGIHIIAWSDEQLAMQYGYVITWYGKDKVRYDSTDEVLAAIADRKAKTGI